MDQYLVRINNVEDAPPESYVIYDIPKNIYYCKYEKYTQFCKHFIYANSSINNYCLTMDLSFTPGHALVFDIDLKIVKQQSLSNNQIMLKYFEDIFIGILKANLLTNLKHFTVIVAMRPNGGGLHVHLPEFTLSHDDYIHFCSQIQSRCDFNLNNNCGHVNLDILANMSLAKCKKKPNMEDHYKPIRVVYFDEKNNNYTLNLYSDREHLETTFAKLKNQFKRRKDNENSIFKKLLALEMRDIENYLYELMMPVIVTPSKPIYKLIYKTIINKLDENEYNNDNNKSSGSSCNNYYRDEETVATFTFKNNQQYFILKGKEINFIIDGGNNNNCSSGNEWLKCQSYLKFNSHSISNFESKNRALKRWFKCNGGRVIHTPQNIFKKINDSLKQDNIDFVEDPNPLNTILKYEKGYYFLPVFYALCQTLKLSSAELIPEIRKNMFSSSEGFNNDKDDNFRVLINLLDRLEKIDPKIIENSSQNFTLDTILYCGTNLKNITKTKMKEKIKSIIHDMKGVLLFVENPDQMSEHIKRIQERYFPTMVVTLRHSCKKPLRFMWNLINEYWQDVNNNTEIHHLISTIWASIQRFLNAYHPSKDWYKQVNISEIVSSILAESNVDRKIIEMDRHKWHIRTNDGILDLLTGHVGATVPEFYMSQIRLSILLNRHQLMDIRDKRDDLLQIYKTLTNKTFFQTFLKKIFMDETDNLHDTLLLICDNKNIEDEYIASMYNFYLHVCKYNSFEYDRIMYFFDVIASMLVATNYARKFFILKGETRNGKSKFFQMIARVFGGYSHTIRSVNLNHNSHGLNAQPELASSLFGCRVVTVEEMSGRLNENLVKEITGNSTTSFRNLYEQNSGGIPTAKIFASTNSFPECIATEAFKDRVVTFPFESVFTKEAASLKTSEQVLKGKYLLETSDAIIEDSYIGFFLMMYLHLMENMNLQDGTIHYRPEPEALVEFKAHFLFMTDIYVQFKQYVDLQVMPESITTFNDLKSAVRYFLKTTRNTSIQESEIILKFDAEYGYLKRTEVNLGSFSSVLSNFAEEEGNDSLYTQPLTCNNMDIEEEVENNEEETNNTIDSLNSLSENITTTTTTNATTKSGVVVEEDFKKPPSKRRKKEQQMNKVIMSCSREEYHDLKLLESNNSRIDKLIDYVRSQNSSSLRVNYMSGSYTMRGFNDISIELVDRFEKEAIAHITHLLNNTREYKTLYWVIDHVKLFHQMEIKYYDFPLMKRGDTIKVLAKIRLLASKFFKVTCIKFDITCLYLIYFYALLVNWNATWTEMDYLNSGIRHHQYFIENSISEKCLNLCPSKKKCSLRV